MATVEIMVTKRKKQKGETHLFCGGCGGQICRCEGFTEKENALSEAVSILVVAYQYERHPIPQQPPATEDHSVVIWASEGRAERWFVYRVNGGRPANENFLSFCSDRERRLESERTGGRGGMGD